MSTEKILKFILAHIDAGTIDTAFNDENFDRQTKAYVLEPFDIRVSAETLQDIKSNPDHYRQFISA
jgi:hypothetical protein